MIKATIQAREIRIGNIIQFDDTSEDIVRVEYVFQSDEMWFIQWTWISGKGSFKSGNSILEDFEPIPLSPEILDKCGWDYKDQILHIAGPILFKKSCGRWFNISL